MGCLHCLFQPGLQFAPHNTLQLHLRLALLPSARCLSLVLLQTTMNPATPLSPHHNCCCRLRDGHV